MTKSELVSAVIKATSMQKGEAEKSVETFISSIIEAVSKGERVALSGFGIFSVSDRKERNGKNPRTGESLTIPPSRVPKFSAGKAFKDKANPIAIEKPTEPVKDKPKVKKKKG
ncbi:MAG: HU family DNA-binding protein [Nitrospirae bacterium]|nr:HU family DNA-binding protein [Nitrospirota bacterium]